jgi:hypothetical protein
MTGPYEAIRAALPAYDVTGELGRGGWGVVLAGHHRQLGRLVAIKQLPPNFATDAIVRGRFTSEARLLASLDHPHVVPVYDFVDQDGLCLLVMELLPNGSVWQHFKAEGFSAPSAVAVALAVAAGLKSAHDAGILHRDVKPENLMFGANGTLKVTDFGIAKMVGGGETLATRAGDVLGTPAYMAPEQARGLALTPATDVYALATVLYELLAGRLPFPDETDPMALLFKHAFEPPVPLQQAAPFIPVEVTEVVMHGLATDPASRYPTAEAFGAALSAASYRQWGPSWLTSQAVPVLGASTMTMPPPPGLRAPPTVHAGPIVRPVEADHAPAIPLAELSEADLVPVQKVAPPPKPLVPFVVASALALAVLVIAAVGLGSPARGGSLAGRSIIVAGQSAVGSHRVTIDLTKPVAVRVGRSRAADHIRLSLLAGGVALRTVDAPRPRSGAAVLPALRPPYVFGGHVTGRLELLTSGAVVGTWQFAATTKQSPYLTAVAGGDALLVLFAAGYLESFLRAMRRSRSRVSGSVGVPIAAALLGVGAVIAAWVVLGREPTPSSLIACAVVAAGAGIAATIGALRIGRRRRFRRRTVRPSR